MNRNFTLSTAIIFFAIFLLTLTYSCRKKTSDAEAFAVIDKIAINYANNRIYNEFTLSNTGQKTLSYQVDEQIDWLEITNPMGELDGRSDIEIICKVNRTGLPKNNYSGKLFLYTNNGDFTIDVYMMVDMYIVTFINPVFTTIALKIDTVLFSADTNLYAKNIGKNDSAQFGFFSSPDLVTYYAQTSGRYTDSTQLGLKMTWEGQKVLSGLQTPRLFLDISKAYFHLSIINNNQVLNPLYVNAGTPYEFLENVFVYQSSDPLPVGYYHALANTLIRAYVAGASTSVTWSNGGQFTLPFTINQAIIIDTYSNDTIKKKSYPFPQQHINEHRISRNYGNVIDILSK